MFSVKKEQKNHIKSKNLRINTFIKILFIFEIIAFITLSLLNIAIKNNKKEIVSEISPELARARNYNIVGENDNKTQSEFVEFDAFFLRDLNLDGIAEGVRGTCREIGKEDTMYMELKVLSEGKLEDAVITINGDRNFYFETAIVKDTEIKENSIGKNVGEVKFNTIESGSQKFLTGIVKSGDYTSYSQKAAALNNNKNNYSKENTITLTGTHVITREDGSEERTPINKEVKLTVDWYAQTKTEIPNIMHYSTENIYQNKNIENIIDTENQEINLIFTIYTEEINNQLLLNKSHIEGTIPQLNGFDPKRVEVSGTNVTFNYTPETRLLTAEREAVLDEEGNITSIVNEGIDSQYHEKRYNSYELKITYSLDAFDSLGSDTILYSLPIKAYYDGYNNPNEEFKNPYSSDTEEATFHITFRKFEGYGARYYVYVGDYLSYPKNRYVVSKQKPARIYNKISEEEKEDFYKVEWSISTGSKGKSSGIVVRDSINKDGEKISDQFIKANGTKESMEEVTDFVGLYINNPISLLGENGEVKVYDEDTNILIATFNKDNWNKYNSINPYMYEIPVKHIRIETSATKNDGYMYVYNIKEINDEIITEKYEKEQFDDLRQIECNITGYLGGVESGNSSSDTGIAYYEEANSMADINVNRTAISTQETESNFNIIISAEANKYENSVKWKNGVFLIKLPKDIVDVKINNIYINNNNVEIISQEITEVELNGEKNKCIKLITESEEESYRITIDCDITADPRVLTYSENMTLYASNEIDQNYYYKGQDIYDINGNLNVDENVNVKDITLNLISPASLLTNQSASNYDSKGSISIAPQILSITKDQRTVDVCLEVKNNSTTPISEIKILGKIPFKGNKYVINKKDLGSDYNTTMSNKGIIIPEELNGLIKVYYTTEENPNKELDDITNKWTEKPENFDEVKCFLIDFEDTILERKEQYSFSYQVLIPEGLDYNQVSYGHHGVYFSLNTSEGKYRTQLEPNKLGFRLEKEFSLELTKYQKDTDKVVPKATYSIKAVGEDESITRVTSEDGKFTIDKLYVEKQYEIQEIKSPKEYTLNKEVIKFTTKEENGKLILENVEGTNRKAEVVKREGEDYKVVIETEDEEKASLVITKKQSGTENKIQGARFKITGSSLPTTGTIITTDTEGKAEITGLDLGQEYSLEEVKVNGYYLASPVKFTITKNEGKYSLETKEEQKETVTNKSITIENMFPTINLELVNDKIPTYNLTIKKVEKGQEDKTLQGAQFRLLKDGKQIGKFTTNESGLITIEDLYAYEEERQLNQTYKIQEIAAPEGYAKMQDIEFVVIKDEEGNYNFSNSSGTITNIETENNNIEITLADSPSFKLTKKDAETGKLLPNTKFAIFNIDDDEIPAKNSKGETIGTKEIINDKEYYVVTTDQNGQIKADLPQGLYKAVEVKAADEKYELADATYFGIGLSRETDLIPKVKYAEFLSELKMENLMNLDDGFGLSLNIATTATSDGGYITGGGFFGNATLSNGEILTGDSKIVNGVLVKYDEDNEVEWTTSIGSYDEEYDYDSIAVVTSVAETTDGGYIASGVCTGNITLGEGIELNNMTEEGTNVSGMLIKYDNSGKAVWAKALGHINISYRVFATSDGGYIVTGVSVERKEVEIDEGGTEERTFINGTLTKYNSNNEVVWENKMDGENGIGLFVSATETNDGGFVAGGLHILDLKLSNNEELSTKIADALIIKYDSQGNIQKVDTMKGDEKGVSVITAVKGTQDGGFIAGGAYTGTIKLNNNQTITNDQELPVLGENLLDFLMGRDAGISGLLIKYDKDNEIEWAKDIGDKNDIVLITAVEENAEGNYVLGGMVRSSILIPRLGDDKALVKWIYEEFGMTEEELRNLSEAEEMQLLIDIFTKAGIKNTGSLELDNGQVLTSDCYIDGLLLEYNNQGEVEWGQTLGASEIGLILSVDTMKNGETLVGGIIGGTKAVDLAELILNELFELEDEEKIDISNIDTSEMQLGEYKLKTDLLANLVVKYEKDNISNLNTKSAISFGDKKDENIMNISETKDGGYLIIGSFESSTINVGNQKIENKGESDGIIVKYNSNNIPQWTIIIGGNGEDCITYAQETKDEGYIIIGTFTSQEIHIGDATIQNKGNKDGIIIKLNKDKEVEWTKSIGGEGIDSISSIAETNNGEFIVVGTVESQNVQIGDYVIKNLGKKEGIIVKLNKDGNVEFATTLKGEENEALNSVIATSDGYIIGGFIESNNAQIEDKIIESTEKSDAIIIKFDNNNNIIWYKIIGSDGDEYISSISEDKDGGYIVAGNFTSQQIDLDGYKLTRSFNSKENTYDGMIIKYNKDGKVEWTTTIGGRDDDKFNSIYATQDGGFVVGGSFLSTVINARDYKINNSGKTDGMIVKYSRNGQIEWINSIGSTGEDYINSIIETTSGKYLIAGTFEESITLTNNKKLISNGSKDGMILKLMPEIAITELGATDEGLVVENKIKTFNITTDVLETYGTKGGRISGEDAEPYEKVKYNESNKKEIKIIPNKGYEIIKLTVNGKDVEFTKNEEDGSYILPKFDNIKEDKHIEVTFIESIRKFVLHKRDESEKEIKDSNENNDYSLEGAKFKIEQIDEREKLPDSVFEEIYSKSREYAQIDNETEIEGKISETINEGSSQYTFSKDENGKIIPNNTGVDDSRAHSYIEIDLTDSEEDAAVVLNASISSEKNYDEAFAYVTTNTYTPYEYNHNYFMKISGEIENKDYVSQFLTKGQRYYLHLVYEKDDSTEEECDDTVIINSIKLYKAEKVEYYFESENKGDTHDTLSGLPYISNNQHKGETDAISCIPINLEDYEGKYTLTINAEISSQENHDYGYAIVKDYQDEVEHTDTYGRFIHISGTKEETNYTKVLEGGYKYYLYFGYYKDAEIDGGKDIFKINSIEIKPSDSGLYKTEITTDKNGDAILNLPVGKYNITEIEAPKGYDLPEDPSTVYEMKDEGINEVTIYNTRTPKVIVHHYLKGTGIDGIEAEKIAEDEIFTGKIGEDYKTEPKSNLQQYELSKGEDGEYIIPKDANGKFEAGIKEITYFYEKTKVKLTVHHFVEGTITPVLLSSGEKSVDIVTEGDENTEYETEPLSKEELNEKYELKETPYNSTGTYQYPDVEVTYEYNEKEYAITTKVNPHIETDVMGNETEVKGGEISGETENPYEIVKYNESSSNELKITPYENYIVDYITINDRKLTEKDYTIDEEGNILLNTIENITEDKNIVVSFKKIETSVLVHYYLDKTETKVPTKNGGEVQDVIRKGGVGDEYVTKESDEIPYIYELVKEPENASGVMTKNQTVVNYYYKLRETKIKNTLRKEGPNVIGTLEDKINYNIIYKAKVDALDGKVIITIVDKLPCPIDEQQSEIQDGIYEETTNENGEKIYTITWKNEIEVNAFKIERAEEIEITKSISLKYKFDNLESSKIVNNVKANAILEKQNEEDPSKYEKVKEENIEAQRESIIGENTSVIVHHYIYDAETKKETTTKLAEDEIIQGYVGKDYSTKPSDEVPKNYACKDENPDKNSGTMTKEVIHVNYYYVLTTPKVTSNIEKTAIADEIEETEEKEAPISEQSKANEILNNVLENKIAEIDNIEPIGEGKVAVITKENGAITYKIKYTTEIKDYIGDATIKIVDKLPAKIDTQKSELNGGIYNEKDNTITWNENIKDINTYEKTEEPYKDGTYKFETEKEIKIVYIEQDIMKDLVNNVTGKTEVYYPEIHSSKPEEVQVEKQSNDNVTVKQNYKTTIEIEKIWDDNDNKKEDRPESITVLLKEKEEQEAKEIILNDENNWKYTEEGLPKYDNKTGRKLEYVVTEKETTEGDLEKYEEPEIITVDESESETNYKFIINAYKLNKADFKANITKEGSEEIKTSKDEINYKIHFTAEIPNYQGEVIIKIIDQLPYKLDTEKTDMENGLAGGTYNDILKTITWIKKVEDVNTDTNGTYKIDEEKEITVVYKNVNLNEEKITNNVKGRIELYDTLQYDQSVVGFDTSINLQGKVIVKYIDIDTKNDPEPKEIAPMEIITGKIGTNYKTTKKDIENYVYTEDTGNTEGIISEEDQEVIYYYTKNDSKIIVKYHDTEGNILAEDVIITGKSGTPYTTEEKKFENYKLVKVEGTKEGIMQEGQHEVVYIYDRTLSGILNVKYVDIETNESITCAEDTEEMTKGEKYDYTISGYVGDKYTTGQKEIPYYIFIKSTDNTEGVLTEKGDTITYYYKKQVFNISLNKYLESILVNGNNININNNKLIKYEVVGTRINSTNIVVSYNIEVRNTGEIDGTAKILETIPEGFNIIAKDERLKANESNNLEAELEVKSGETIVLNVKLEWIKNGNNFGEKTNEVKILETKNKAGFTDVNDSDDISNATIVLAIKTGIGDNLKIYSVIITFSGMIALLGYVIVKKAVILYE